MCCHCQARRPPARLIPQPQSARLALLGHFRTPMLQQLKQQQPTLTVSKWNREGPYVYPTRAMRFSTFCQLQRVSDNPAHRKRLCRVGNGGPALKTFFDWFFAALFARFAAAPRSPARAPGASVETARRLWKRRGKANGFHRIAHWQWWRCRARTIPVTEMQRCCSINARDIVCRCGD